MIARVSILLFISLLFVAACSCALATGVNGPEEDLLSKLFADSPEKRLSPRRTLRKLVKVVNKLEEMNTTTSQSLNGTTHDDDDATNDQTKAADKLKLLRKLIDLSSPTVEKCANMSTLLKDYESIIDKHLRPDEEKLIMLEGEARGSNLFEAIQHFKVEQFGLCAIELDKRVHSIITTRLAPFDRNRIKSFYIKLLHYKRDTEWVRITKGSRDFIKSEVKKSKTNEALKNEASPAMFNRAFEVVIVDLCQIVHDRLKDETTEYSNGIGEFAELNENTVMWLEMSKVCGKILSNESVFRKKVHEKAAKKGIVAQPPPQPQNHHSQAKER